MRRQEKGKIPHSEWGAIRTRFAGGESLASIARSFNCTAPAIRYIVNRRERAEGAEEKRAAEPAAPASTLLAGESPPKGDMTREIAQPQRPSEPQRTVSFDSSSGVGQRITSEIAKFLVALDGVGTDLSERNLATLREATDRLLRAVARMRIELDRAATPERRGEPEGTSARAGRVSRSAR